VTGISRGDTELAKENIHHIVTHTLDADIDGIDKIGPSSSVLHKPNQIETDREE